MTQSSKNAFLVALKDDSKRDSGLSCVKTKVRSAHKRASSYSSEQFFIPDSKRQQVLNHGSVESISSTMSDEQEWNLGHAPDVDEYSQVFEPASFWEDGIKFSSNSIADGDFCHWPPNVAGNFRKSKTFPKFEGQSTSERLCRVSCDAENIALRHAVASVDLNNNIVDENTVHAEDDSQFIQKFEAASSSASKSCEIYCHGPVLEAAQNAYIYNDSKSFVDMKMNTDSDVILNEFDKLRNASAGKPTDNEVKLFVNEHFQPPGSEFENWTPSDWKDNPTFLKSISDPALRAWASDLNELWKALGRKIVNDVSLNSSRYSMIYSPNPIIVPGGRFREFYYWDCYWIIRGLLLSEMYTTVKGSIQNFLHMVNRFGFVPNGGRLYYTRRSQPPFLTLMVREYVNKTGDDAFMRETLPTLEREYDFWMSNRSVSVQDSEGNTHLMNRYASEVNQPRPESYREDAELISELNSGAGLELMSHVTSACESGWDFSSRWTGSCYKNTSSKLLKDLRTRDIIPVDLNSILANVEQTLAQFHKTIGDEQKFEKYLAVYNKRTESIEKLLWHEEDGTYYDLLISEKAHNRQFFCSNLNPLWTKCYAQSVDVMQREKRLHEYLKNLSVLNYPGGIPTSLNDSGQQWDFPNAWPPLVHMVIGGMATSASPELQKEALHQAQKWIRSNWKAYKNTNAMFEKYDVTRADGLPGGGGEYDVQTGFGWTNGVVMILLDMYGDQLVAEPNVDASTSDPPTSTSNAQKNLAVFGPLAVTATLAGLSSNMV